MTAGGRRGNLAPQPEVDIRQIIQDAQNRWLRPAEVCEILRNYKQHNFKLNPVPPITPQSGSLFLFDRKALRYFRKDGHNWRKKKDGKTVREAHERLKAGSIDVLHCYYAHGEDNPNFQRRAYWMLDPAYEHIVLVHYREVTEGNRLCMIRNMHGYGASDTALSAATLPALHSQPPSFGSTSVNSLGATTSMASPDTVEMPGTSPELEDVDTAEPDDFEDGSAVPEIAGDPTSLQPSLLEQLTDRQPVPPIQPWQAAGGLRNANSLGGIDGQVIPHLFPPQKDFKPPFTDLQNLSQRAPPISSRYRTGDTLSRFADILDSPGPSYNLPASSSSNSLDLSGWTNLLENGRGSGGLGNGGGNFVKSELNSPAGASPWEAMFTQLTTPNSRRTLLQGAGLNPGLGQSPLGRDQTHQPLAADTSPKGKGIVDALSPRNLGREPQSALEADLRDVSEKIVLKEAEEKAARSRWQTFSDSPMVNDANNQRMQAQSGAQQMNAMPFGEPDTLGALVRSGQPQQDSSSALKQESQWAQQQQNQGVKNLINQYEHQTSVGQQNFQQPQQDNKMQVSVPPSQQNNFAFLDSNNLFSPTIESYLKDVQNDDSSNLGIMETYKKLGSFGKLDSFGRWMNTAEDITDIPSMPGTSGSLWESGYQEDAMSGAAQHMDEGTSPSPSLSEQLFNIIDISPEWGYSTEETKVIICGSFMPMANYTDHTWCCMFGETEVPVEILGEGLLRCKAPKHIPGEFPLYITRNDRQACSQVRSFTYRSPDSSSGVMSYAADAEVAGDTKEELLLKIRLSRMLLGHASPTNGRIGNRVETFEARDNKEWTDLEDMLRYSPLVEVKEKLLQTILNYKLKEWLQTKAEMEKEDGRGPRVLDDGGQGVPHFLAALGYDWSVAPLFVGQEDPDKAIPINFRDHAGWTALHWAAKYGREKMVVALLEAGAAPVLGSDPTKACPRGQTAADLASAGGHGGIAGFLAEKSLTERLSGLTLGEKATIIPDLDKFSADMEGEKAVAQLARRTSIVRSVHVAEDQIRLRTSLEAVRSSTQAAALIQSAFRQDSLRRKAFLAPIDDEGADEYGLSPEDMQNFVAARKIQAAFRGHQKNKIKQHLAAIRIQQKFRGWKGRKEFINIRQRIIKLQAHVRGRLVRNQYRKIIWSVSIVEKIVLRWLRKRKGLKGFRSEKKEQIVDNSEDLLKEGRAMQKEAVQEDVEKVRLMARQKSDRDQYTRMRDEERRSSANKGELNDFLTSPRDYMDRS
ncbi:unnamed protein product [Calypogeia fissa]